MRLSNKNKASTYQFIGTSIVIFSMFSVVIFLADHYEMKSLGWKAVVFMFICFLSLVIFYLRGRQIFEYDSDGEALNFKNRDIMSLIKKSANDEFPKYKLIKYEVVNAIIFKRLYVTIASKKTHSTTLKYDISYLTSKEIQDLKYSLSKVVKDNKGKS